jgi:hypothetical protein
MILFSRSQKASLGCWLSASYASELLGRGLCGEGLGLGGNASGPGAASQLQVAVLYWLERLACLQLVSHIMIKWLARPHPTPLEGVLVPPCCPTSGHL